MFFRDLKPKSDVTLAVHPVHVNLPVRLGNHDAAEVFATPLDRQLMAAGAGRVSECRARITTDGEPESLDLFLALTAVGPDALNLVAGMLEALGAPRGSTLRRIDGGDLVQFGRAVGMGVYVDDRGGIDGRGIRRIAEACAASLGDAGTMAGSARVQDRIAFYFYGEDYTAMRQNLARGIERHPALRGVVSRRLI